METLGPTPQTLEGVIDAITVLTWKQSRRRAELLATILERAHPDRHFLYGVPRGGAIAAGLVHLAAGDKRFEVVSDLGQADIIIDDIIDSGATKARYQAMRDLPFHALVNKQAEDSVLGWVQFPWEEEAKVDIEDNVRRVLEFIGEDPNREGLKQTPGRVVRSWGEMFNGYKLKPEDVLQTQFQETCDQMVILDNIEFYSTCEHHMLPFTGRAHVAYLPKDKIVGISKLARLVDCYAHRLQVQERMTQQIAGALFRIVDAHGVGVMVEAQHFCMMCRGVQKQNSIMRTSALLGTFRKPEVRQEFFSLIGQPLT